MSYDDDFSRANERLIGFPAMYMNACGCYYGTYPHSSDCRKCELLDKLPEGFICLLGPTRLVERILPKGYFDDYPDSVLRIAERALTGDLDMFTVVSKYFGEPHNPVRSPDCDGIHGMLAVKCFGRLKCTSYRGDVLRMYAELNGIEVTF